MVLTRCPNAIIRSSVWKISEQVVSVISRWPRSCRLRPTGLGVLRQRVEHPDVGERDDQVLGVRVEPVDVRGIHGLHDDLVARPQLRHPAQRLAVGDPVRGERVVADAPRVGRVGKVPEATGQIFGGDPLENRYDVGPAEPGDTDESGGLTLRDLPGRQLRIALLPLRPERARDLCVLALSDPVGAPELPADVAQQAHSGADQQHAHPRDDAAASGPGTSHPAIVVDDPAGQARSHGLGSTA